MHESGLVRSLVARAELTVADAGMARATRIGVRIGALSGVDPDVVRATWKRFATGSTRDAELEVIFDDDPVAVGSLGIELAFVDVVE